MFDSSGVSDSLGLQSDVASNGTLLQSEAPIAGIVPALSSPTADLMLSAAPSQSLPSEPAVASFSTLEADSLSATNPGQRLILEADQLGDEQAELNAASGAFVVGTDGEVEIDFLFDGGQYAGELAIFNLAGMGGLGKEAFAEEAIARALSGDDGQVVISDRVEGAQFSGELGERDRNQGTAANTQKLTLTPGTHFAFMIVPNTTVAAIANGASDTAPFFSISAFNPDGQTQIAQASDGIFAVEDILFGQGDNDFNDLIFQVDGATSNVTDLSQLVASNKNWLDNPTAQPFLIETRITDPTTPIIDGPGSDGSDGSDDPGGSGSDGSDDNSSGGSGSDGPGSDGSGSDGPGSSDLVADISDVVHKFSAGSNREQIINSGANSITIGSQTIYIGTNQVSSINQNPIIRSFDATNPENNWTRTDLETTGTDGRGLGLVWTGSALYGVFSVDGTQGQPAEDFRRATGDAEQNWLKSFGSGAGKIAVIGQIDPVTGALLKAAYLSAVKQNGKTNSLSVEDITVNSTGNLVISAKSFFNPRRPDGTAMTRDPEDTGDSPFDYTVEITADLSRVVSTSAEGWS